MFKVVIQTLSGETFAEFKTLQEANAWIAEIEPTGAWGHVGNEEYVNEIGETVPARAKEYSIEIVDITEEAEREREINKYEARIRFGVRLMAELAAMNKKSLDSGELTALQVLDLKTKLASVKDFLVEGSLGFAAQELEQTPDIPAEMKAYFLNKMTDYLSQE